MHRHHHVDQPPHHLTHRPPTHLQQVATRPTRHVVTTVVAVVEGAGRAARAHGTLVAEVAAVVGVERGAGVVAGRHAESTER